MDITWICFRDFLFTIWNSKQECIPVGCVPPACWCRGSASGGSASRGVCIWGVCTRGVCIQGGLHLGSLHAGICIQREGSAFRGECLGGLPNLPPGLHPGCGGVGQTPFSLWTEWHTGVKTLPCPKLRLRAVVNVRIFSLWQQINALFRFFLCVTHATSVYCPFYANTHLVTWKNGQ